MSRISPSLAREIDALEPPGPNPHRRRVGSLGGKASAARLSQAQRIARSTVAGNTILQRFGIGYYQYIGHLSGQKSQKKKLT